MTLSLKNEILDRKAWMIQEAYKDYKTKKSGLCLHKTLLELGAFFQAIKLTEDPNFHILHPKAVNGKTHVIIPASTPCVIKFTGSAAARHRIGAMKMTQDVLESLGLKNLFVPQARCFGDLLIESKLPITHFDLKEQMGLYAENPQLFSQAIQELACLLCHITLDDITGNTSHRYTSVSDTPLGRYDNIPLYIEEGIGKIGLVDLEKCQKGPINPLNTAKQLIHLFPLHAEPIVSTISRYYPDILMYEAPLGKEQLDSSKRLKTIYLDHAEFLKTYGLNQKDQFLFSPMKEELKNVIESELFESLYEKHSICHLTRGFLGSHPKETLKILLDRHLDDFFSSLKDLFIETVDYNIDRLQKPLQKPNFITFAATRSLTIPYGFDQPMTARFKAKMSEYLSSLELNEFQKGFIITFILDKMLEKLTAHGLICYYNPAFASQSVIGRLVFC